jgi:GDPmannose 4,6-dehydratase
MTTALITGINGQDGSYLADQLLAKGVEVHGILRPEALLGVDGRDANIRHLHGKASFHACDIADAKAVDEVIAKVKPDQCYHFAAESFVHHDLENEESIMHSNCTATHTLLESLVKHAPHCRFYFAASSELFGNALISPQNETTPFNPRAMYGISKLAAYHVVRNYREKHGVFACAGILYNHESPRRGLEFVTRKITSTVAKIHLGQADSLALGNLDAVRDWGYAPEYVDAMQRMLTQATPDDYVIATGQLRSVREFLEAAFGVIGKRYEDYVVVNPDFFRENEKVPLCGDASKAKRVLGWQPQKPFEEMVREMVENDIAQLKSPT